MSLFNRRLALAVLIAPLAACNFQPVYGPGGSGQIIRDRISVAAPETRLEFELVARLEDRLGIGGGTYTLDYNLVTAEPNQAIDGAENIDRINIAGTLGYEVRLAATGQLVADGSVNTFIAYATTASPVATAAARRDAEDRLMVALADQLVTQLVVSAPNWP